MPVFGTSNDDDIQLPEAVPSEYVDLGDGEDILRLADGKNFVYTANVETVIGGSGNDTLLATDGALQNMDGGAGIDELNLTGAAAGLQLRSVERVIGNDADQFINYAFGSEAVDATPNVALYLGYDIVHLDNVSGERRSIELGGVEEVRVTQGAMDITLFDPSTSIVEVRSDADTEATVRSRDGAPIRMLSYGQNTVEGTSASDIMLVADDAMFTMVGNGGNDTVTALGYGSNLDLTDVGSVTGSEGSDQVIYTITAGREGFPHAVDLGDGNDAIDIINQGPTRTAVSLTGVEFIYASGAVDVLMNDRAYQTEISGNSLSSQVYLFNDGVSKTANLVNLRGFMSIEGSGGRDVIRVADDADVFLNLGAGNDRVELVGSGRHVATVSNVEAVLGSKGDDLVRVVGASTLDPMSIDMADGFDTLDLTGYAGGHVLVSNVERVLGSEMDDRLLVRTAAKNMVLDMNGGDDIVQFAVGGNTATVSGVEVVLLTSGNNRITVKSDDITDVEMNGGTGADTLIGGAGDDVIYGGYGKDIMTGGNGANVFVFSEIRDSDLVTRDIITDFQVGVDTLRFNNMLSGQFSLTVGDRFGGFEAEGNTQAFFHNIDKQLLIDTDGDGQMDMRMTLQGVDGSQLSTSDFFWNNPI